MQDVAFRAKQLQLTAGLPGKGDIIKELQGAIAARKTELRYSPIMLDSLTRLLRIYI